MKKGVLGAKSYAGAPSRTAGGYGVPVNFVQGYFWLNLAAAAGLEEAQQRRDWLVNFLTPEQIARAQQAAANWSPARHKASCRQRTPAPPSAWGHTADHGDRLVQLRF